jgi:dihydropteroate synthase
MFVPFFLAMDFLRVEDNYFPRHVGLNIEGKLFTIAAPAVMGIINCTPDSFYAESRKNDVSEQLKTIDQFVLDGASWLDVGGYSTRPGAIEISEKEEIERILPAIQYIRATYPDIVISVDTFRANVARAAIENGAHVINDISGGTLDENMFKTVGELACPYILMHLKGTPQNMQQFATYDQLFKEVCLFFSQQISKARAAGINDIILDPGFGFAKTTDQNFDLFGELENLHLFHLPILVGISRKSMIYKTLNITPQEALNGTTALHAIAVEKGAAILRVHDPKAVRETIELIQKIR